MSRHFRRVAELGPLDRQRMLDALGAMRKTLHDVQLRLKPASPTYQRSMALVSAIDDLVEAITGDRSHFHLKGHGGSYTFSPLKR